MMEKSSIGSTDATVIDLADDLAECPMWGGDGWDLAFGRLACGFLNAGLFGGLEAASKVWLGTWVELLPQAAAHPARTRRVSGLLSPPMSS